MQRSIVVQHVSSSGIEEPLDLHALAGGHSFADIAGRLQAALMAHYRVSGVAVLSREAGMMWEHIAGAEPPDALTMPGLGPGSASTVQFWDEGHRVIAAQRLHDGRDLVVHLNGKAEDRRFDAPDLLTLRMSLMAFDAAWAALLHRKHEKELLFELNRRLLQLNSLIDTGIEVATLDVSVSPALLALERAVALTNASRGTVTVLRDDAVVSRDAFPPGTDALPAGEHVLRSEFVFQGATYAFEITDKETRKGIQAFDGTDRLLLDALTRQVQASLENRFLLKQSLEKQKIEQDIAVAASIQQRILPSALPEISGYSLAGINIPSKSVGGDYYDCIPLPDGRFILVIADVSGKGIPAALLVSSLHAYLSAYLETALPLVDIVARLNTAIHNASTDDKFITAYFAVLDPATGELESVNAGHNTIYLRKVDGTVKELQKGGIPLGMLDLGLPYESENVTLEAGDRLLLYTDGIPEAQDAGQELYDTAHPLKEFFATVVPCTAAPFLDALMADLRRFVQDAPQADDITALYIMRL
jgi:serine phosphatase RsbU (regulator of sigma subunit)